MKSLAVFDIDGVLYDGHSIFDVITLQEKQKIIKDGVSAQIHSLLKSYKLGQLSYVDSANKMLNVYVSSLEGLKYEDMKEFVKAYLLERKDQFYPYFEEILPKIKKTHDVFLLTTNLSFTAEVIVEMFNLKGCLATQIEVKDGVITGKVLESLSGNKKVIERLFQTYEFKDSIAVGDSENDIQMLEKVNYPICMDPSEILLIKAKIEGWRIANKDTMAQTLGSLLK